MTTTVVDSLSNLDKDNTNLPVGVTEAIHYYIDLLTLSAVSDCWERYLIDFFLRARSCSQQLFLVVNMLYSTVRDSEQPCPVSRHRNCPNCLKLCSKYCTSEIRALCTTYDRVTQTVLATAGVKHTFFNNTRGDCPPQIKQNTFCQHVSENALFPV